MAGLLKVVFISLTYNPLSWFNILIIVVLTLRIDFRWFYFWSIVVVAVAVAASSISSNRFPVSSRNADSKFGFSILIELIIGAGWNSVILEINSGKIVSAFTTLMRNLKACSDRVLFSMSVSPRPTWTISSIPLTPSKIL